MPFKHGPPEKMIFQLTLRRRGISDQAVLRAMEGVPREAFVVPADRADAYRDSALGIACGQTISQPFVVAYMTEQLQLKKRHRVLEIGTGSGYQAAVLSRLAGTVLTVERFRTLADTARRRLEKAGFEHVALVELNRHACETLRSNAGRSAGWQNEANPPSRGRELPPAPAGRQP